MDEKFGIDIIDGKIINWDKLTDEELEKLQKELEEKEDKIRKEINELLNI